MKNQEFMQQISMHLSALYEVLQYVIDHLVFRMSHRRITLVIYVIWIATE